jgi:damage-control phosphatase, subfamily II, stand-alone protein
MIFAASLASFCKLADPGSYVACNWDMAEDSQGRTYWVEFFKRHFNTILAMGIDAALARGARDAEVRGRADSCRQKLYARLDAFAANPAGSGRVTILTLDEWRDILLREFGFVDPFVDLKNRENEKVLPLLASVCQEVDALPEAEKVRALIEGMFAGNIFDMGAEATAKAFLAGGPGFFEVRGKLAKRPWLIDDYDALHERLMGAAYRKCVFFVDNAGSDFILGAVPFMRYLAMRGTRVVMAANERPTLNDMSIEDVRRWWPRMCEAEPSLARLAIEAVSTGTGEPLIDLSKVSAELNKEAEDADLVVLEGMGRGVESNLDAEFSCDALNIAMVKDEAVARRVGGRMYDLVCRFR